MLARARVGLCGALGGAINAWAWLGHSQALMGHWTSLGYLVPAGAFHGGVLAAVAYSFGTAFSTRRLRTRLAIALPVAWMAGFLSWIPMNRTLFDESWAGSFGWPFLEGWGTALLSPLLINFGSVALVYYLAVSLYLARDRRLTRHVALAAVAGVVGSLWWWIGWKPWYLSVYHGIVWGTFVGVGAWSVTTPTPTVDRPRHTPPHSA